MGKGPPPRASRPDFGGLLPRADDPEALVRANRLAALGTLVAGVAHEINNPISYVLGNLSELETLGSAMREDDSPVPNSTRPLETRSSVAMRSATRAGWL